MTVDNFDYALSEYPAGAILPWSNDPSNIPPGWVLCDGNNGTPNLLDTFPKSVPDGTTDPGSTGGEHSKTLSQSQLPSHTHSGDTDGVGDHNHEVNWRDSNHNTNDSFDETFEDWSGTADQQTETGGSHSHSLTSGTTGSDSSYDNRPASRELVHMMRV